MSKKNNKKILKRKVDHAINRERNELQKRALRAKGK